MFGKKGSSGSSKSKPKSKSVKQGPKVNFFAAHAEKLALGLVMGALGFLVYEGFGGKSYDKSHQPKELEDKASQIINNIRNNDPWPAMAALPEPKRKVEHSYTPLTKAGTAPTLPENYSMRPLDPGSGGGEQKRGDPKLFAPIKVMGQSVIGLIAVEADDSYVDPFEDFEDALKLKGKNTGSNQRRGRGADDNAAAMGGFGSDMAGAGMPGGDMSGMGMGGMGMGGMGNNMQRLFPQKYNQGFSLGGMGMGGMGGMGMGMGMGSGMDMGLSGPGMGAPGMGAPGMGAPGMGGTGGSSSLTGGPTIKPKKYKAEPILFNAVTALVPHEELVKEFEAKLKDSASYWPMRDRPIYLSFVVERCEVIGGKQTAWAEVTDASKQLAMMKKWLPAKPQTIPEVIDFASFDQALTMPLPPLLMQDYRRFAKHPDIDWIWDAGMAQMQMQMQAAVSDPSKQDTTLDQMLPGERPTMGGGMGGMGMGMGGGMPGMDGGMGMGMGGGMPGMDGGMGMGMGGGMPGMDGGMAMSGMPGGGMPGMDGGMGMGMGMGMDGGMGMGMGGMGMGGYGGMMPIKYKMIRFYDRLDMSKHVGKVFQYRVRVMMEDPNYPSDHLPTPRVNDMEQDVFARVAKLRAVDDPKVEAVRQENLKLVPGRNGVMPPRKVYNRQKRFSDWSEPSHGIYVRGNDDVYFGKFGKKSGSGWEVDAVMVKLDVSKGAYVPLFMFAEDLESAVKDEKDKEKEKEKVKLPKGETKTPVFKRGSVMAVPAYTTQFAHPLTGVMKRWVNFAFGGWNTVVDIRGGEPLALSNTKDDPLTELGEMMMLMSDGRVEVTNEFDDSFYYRGFTLADEREQAEKGGAAAGAGMGMGMPGGDGLSGS